MTRSTLPCAMVAARALARLARPKGTVLLLVVPLLGYGFAHWDHAIDARRPLALLAVLVAWVLLSAGSLWLNAALDGDETNTLFGAHAPSAPRDLTVAGYVALIAAMAIAFAADERAGLACAGCATLAVLYSHPRTRWKGRPFLGPWVNGVGYGMLSWLAGWSIARVPMTVRTAAAMLLLTLFVVGMCFAAQAYQRDDDERRGYRTLVVTRGPEACLFVATMCARVAVLSVGVLAVVGVYPRLVLLGLPVFVLAERTMSRWRRAKGGGSPALAAEFVLRMLAGGVVLVGLATVESLQ
jgi:4-hydroxybenzoate polyprenyltransferase